MKLRIVTVKGIAPYDIEAEQITKHLFIHSSNAIMEEPGPPGFRISTNNGIGIPGWFETEEKAAAFCHLFEASGALNFETQKKNDKKAKQLYRDAFLSGAIDDRNDYIVARWLKYTKRKMKATAR